MKIPVDIVVGTSAGSAVGALYAMGLPIEVIEERFHRMDWNRGFQDEATRDTKSFRRKQEDLVFSIDGSLGIDSEGLRLKQSLLQGQELRLVLESLFEEARSLASFDDLPRRYRAVATDLETGKAVVLDAGQLSEAVRASMTIPAIYPPVVINGRLLVDGGMANNIPVSVAKALGADIIIAVDISTPLSNRAQLDSMITIVDQLTNFLTRNNAEKQIATLSDQDIFIVPDLTEINAADFSKSDEIVEIGATATRNAATQLHHYALEEALWESYVANKNRFEESAPVLIDEIRIFNPTDIKTDVIRQRLRIKPGMVLDRTELEKDIGLIYGLGYFQSVSYRVTQIGKKSILEVIAEKRSWGSNSVRFSLDYEEDFDLESRFNASFLFNMTELNKYGAEWSNVLRIGSEPLLFTNFYQPLASNNAQYFMVGASISKNQRNLFDRETLTAQYEVSPAVVSFSLGQEVGNRFQFEVGYYREFVNINTDVGQSPLLPEEVHHGYGQASVRYDSLDNSGIPGDGAYLDAKFQLLRPELGDDYYSEIFQFNALKALSHDRYKLNIRLKGQAVLDGDVPLTRLARLGGVGNLSGYYRDRFTGQDGLLAGVELYREMYSANVTFALGASYEIGRVWGDDIGNGMHRFKDAVSLIAVADTFAGPIRLAYSYGDSRNSAVYFTIGKFIQ